MNNTLDITDYMDLESVDECHLEDCIPAAHDNVLDWALDMLGKSPTANALIQDAQAHDWTLALNDCDENCDESAADFRLDTENNTIIINNSVISLETLRKSTYFSSIFVITVARALRDAWQEKRNGSFEKDFNPESILMLERIRNADLDCIAVLIAWELRCDGDATLWRHILGSDDSDLAMRFSSFLEREPTSHFTHHALAATFTQWFHDDERVRVCDHNTLDMMDETLMGSNFRNPFGRQSVYKRQIERLSCLPDKTSYLQHDVDMIMSNPLYAGMNDEVNQLHFMHIMYDLSVTVVQDVPFRDSNLAMRIFPNGQMTAEE